MTISSDIPRKTPFILNPFQSIAGGQALIAGFLIIIVTSVIARIANCRFDGIIDTHVGLKPAATAVYFAEGIGNWFIIALIVTLSAGIVAQSRYRALDVFGTIALSRTPYLVSALVSLLPGSTRYAQHLSAKFGAGIQTIALQPSDLAVFICATFVITAITIFTVVLTYRAFATSCNAKGAKAVWYFIGVVIISEILSKILSYGVEKALG